MKPKVLFLILFVLCLISPASGQEKTRKVIITGNVADINQKPVYGALLLIDGVKTNKITDRKGKYKINVSAGAETIGILTTPPAKNRRTYKREICY